VTLQKNYNLNNLRHLQLALMLNIKKAYVGPWILFLAFNVIISHSSIKCAVLWVRWRQHTLYILLKW